MSVYYSIQRFLFATILSLNTRILNRLLCLQPLTLQLKAKEAEEMIYGSQC